MNKIKHCILDDDTWAEFTKLHTKAIDKNKAKYSFKNQKFFINESYENLPGLLRFTCGDITNIFDLDTYKKIIDKTCEILDSNELKKYNRNKSFIEFHHYDTDSNREKCETFDWHKDDKIVIRNSKVYTIVFYLNKSLDTTGGNLQFKIDDKIHEHKVKTKDIIAFPGDIEHYVTPLDGNGIRDSIIVFIERT